MKVLPAVTSLFFFLLSTVTSGEQADPPAEKTIDLSTAMSAALRNSKSLLYSRFDQKLAAERLRIGARQFLPTLSLGLIHSDSVSFDSPDSRLRKMSLGLKQILFDGGRLALSRRNQKNELRMNGIHIKANTEELMFSVINIYTEVLKFHLAREIQRETFRNAVQQLAIAEEEFRLGAITELDLLDIQLMIANLEIELEQTEQEERLLMYRFARLLDYPANRFLQLRGKLNEQYAGFTSFEDKDLSNLTDYYLEQARKNSLEFLKRGFQVQAYRETYFQTRWSWLPNIQAELELSMSGDSYPLSQPGFSLGLEFSFSLPISPFAATATLGKSSPIERSKAFSVSGEPLSNLEGLFSKQLAEINLSRASTEKLDFEEETKFAIAESLFKIQQQRKALELLRKKVRIGESRLKVQRLRAELGEIKRTEYLESQIELGKVRIEVLTRIVELYNSEISLLRVCGISGLAETYRYIVYENGQ